MLECYVKPKCQICMDADLKEVLPTGYNITYSKKKSIPRYYQCTKCFREFEIKRI